MTTAGERGLGATVRAGRAARPTLEIGGHRLRLSNLDKVLYPATGFTKGEVIEYYLKVAPAMLPHLRDRPLTLRRFPDGVDGTSFYEKHVPRGMPDWVRSVAVPRSPTSEERGDIEFAVASDAATIAWVANLASLELHVPQWRVGADGSPQPPDLLVFDLDPGEPAGVVECAEVALLVRDALRRSHRLEAVVKTSGSKGLQVYVRLPPARRGNDWDDGTSRELAHDLARSLAAERSDLVVTNMRKELRRSKVLVDWSQNSVAKTTVAPYSLRARPSRPCRRR